jgi:hypothetical protein
VELNNLLVAVAVQIGTGANNNNRTVQGYYNSSSVITSVSIRASGDTMDAGTVFVYTSA